VLHVQLRHTCTGLFVLLCWLQVEAQIEEVSASVDAATKALPHLSKEQQAAQVGSEQQHSLLLKNFASVLLGCHVLNDAQKQHHDSCQLWIMRKQVRQLTILLFSWYQPCCWHDSCRCSSCCVQTS
jgi:hypothetical protein